MPESLFVRRPFRKSRLITAIVGSFILHSSLVGLAALHPLFKTSDLITPDTQLDVGPVLGEQVQELILPKDEPVPTPEPQETPPPETPPPDDTPPPTEDPTMDIATPKPDTPKPKPFKLAGGTPPPANAKHGDHPQQGVVGGVPHADKTTGTPGAAHLGVKAHTPKPPYPYQAKAAHLTGSGSFHVTFDGSGHVSNITVSQSIGSGILDNAVVQFARGNWTGAPNSSTNVPVTYTLQ